MRGKPLKSSGWGIEVDKSKATFDFHNAYGLVELVSSDLNPEPAITGSGKKLGEQRPTQIRYFTFDKNLEPEKARERISENFESKYFGQNEDPGQAPLFTNGNYQAKSVREGITNAREIGELENEINEKENELEKSAMSWYIPFAKNYTKDKGFWDYVTNAGMAGIPSGIGLFASSMASSEPEYFLGAICSAIIGGAAYLSHLWKYDELVDKKENELETMKADSHFYKNFRRNVENSQIFVEKVNDMEEIYSSLQAPLSQSEQEETNQQLITAYQKADKSKSPYEEK